MSVQDGTFENRKRLLIKGHAVNSLFGDVVPDTVSRFQFNYRHGADPLTVPWRQDAQIHEFCQIGGVPPALIKVMAAHRAINEYLRATPVAQFLYISENDNLRPIAHSQALNVTEVHKLSAEFRVSACHRSTLVDVCSDDQGFDGAGTDEGTVSRQAYFLGVAQKYRSTVIV